MTDPFKDKDKDKDPKRPSQARITIWVIVTAIALWLIGSGIWGMITPG